MQIATGRVSGVRGYVKGEAGGIYPLIALHKARIRLLAMQCDPFPHDM
jgi:hypothetical protein